MRLAPLGAAVLACALALAGVTAAQASPRHKHARPDSQAARACEFTNAGRVICSGAEIRTADHARVRAGHVAKSAPGDPRPAKWCGWWLRHELGVADRLYNLARAWAHFGSNARGPAVGVLVVWPHHVGIITGRNGQGWVVKSGNDGHRVRERVRSVRGAIAFRWPNRMASND